MRILHTGDIHFSGKLIKEISKCTNFLMEKVKDDPPDVAVIAGDLFDERQTYDSAAFLAAVDFVREVSREVPVLIVQGTASHDGHTLQFLRSERVYVAEKPEQVVLSEDGSITVFDGKLQTGSKVVFSCLPSVSKASVVSVMEGDLNSSNQNVMELIRDVLAGWGVANAEIRAANVPTVLVSHLTVTGSMLSTGQQIVGREIEMTVGDLKTANTDLVCLGHIHKTQNWGEVYYCGSLTRLNFGEEEEKGFYLHTLENDTLSSDFVKTPARTMHTVDFEGLPSTDTDIEVPEGAFVRLRYEVAEEDVHSVDEAAIRESIISSGAGDVTIEKVIVPKERVRAEGISRTLSLEEKLKKWGDVTGLEITSGVIEKLHLLESEEEDQSNETAVA